MFLRCFNIITITQTPSDKYPKRNKIMSLEVINKYDINTGWDNLTNTAKFIIPKNFIAKDLQGNEVPLIGNNIAIGNGDNPLFLRGDRVSFQAGYWYFDTGGVERQYVKLLFDGYISKIYSKLTITLECEDSMWLLKQTPAPDKIWTGKSLQTILTECTAGSKWAQDGGKVQTKAQTKVTFNIGTFYTKNETVAQVLARIKRDIRIGAYTKGFELRIGYPTYYPQDVQDPLNPYIFDFNENIISDTLAYQRKDDVVMSATASSYYERELTVKTKDGKTKTTKKKIQVFVWVDPKTQAFKWKEITDTKQIPANQAGERYDFVYPEMTKASDLANSAINELQKKYYTGFRGEFETFLMPYIPFGDNIKLRNKKIPDQDGTYKVKGVRYNGGFGLGHRQRIILDYKIDV